MTLHERTSDGGTFTVAIECDFATELLTVEVSDQHGSWTLYPTDGRQAMDMFYHPYAYSAAFLNERRIPVGEEVTA